MADEKQKGHVDNAFSGGSAFNPLKTTQNMIDEHENEISLIKAPQSKEGREADLQSFLNSASKIRNVEDLEVELMKYKGIDRTMALQMAEKQTVDRFETRDEQKAHDEKEARAVSGALLGGVAALGVAGIATNASQEQGDGFLSSLFGSNDKYLAGPSALLPASAAHDIATVEHIGGALAQHVQDIIPLDESPSAQQPSHGIPGKVQQQSAGMLFK